MVNILLKLIKLPQVNKQKILCPANYCQLSLIDIPQSKRIQIAAPVFSGTDVICFQHEKRGRFLLSIVKWLFWYLWTKLSLSTVDGCPGWYSEVFLSSPGGLLVSGHVFRFFWFHLGHGRWYFSVLQKNTGDKHIYVALVGCQEQSQQS